MHVAVVKHDELGTSPVVYPIYSWQKKARSSSITRIRCGRRTATGLKAHAGLRKVGRGPALVIARDCYYSNDCFSKWTADRANDSERRASAGRWILQEFEE